MSHKCKGKPAQALNSRAFSCAAVTGERVKKMAKGDHIKVPRENDFVRYTHHGIDCGDGTVIHFTGEPGKSTKLAARICRTSIDDFKKEAPTIEVVEDKSTRTPDEVVAAAESRVGEGGYNLGENNCEHFANHCRTGEHKSAQIEAVENALEAVADVIDAIDEVISDVYSFYKEVKECLQTSPKPDGV